MKRQNHFKERVLEADNLYLAYCKARRGKSAKREVREFSAHFDREMTLIREGLERGDLPMGKYRTFTIRDPKERLICAVPFCERVVHHAIMNICHDTFDRTLIDTTFATRRNKGVYAALDAARRGMARYGFSVKLDVRKYYDSIHHDTLKMMLRRLFKDPWLLALFDRIIDGYGSEGKGLPIGNLTSQYFANLYLSGLDHRAKERWKAHVYIRYMDDILILSDAKPALRHCVEEASAYALEELGLTLKPPVYRDSVNGQNFLGYRVMPHYLTLSGRSKRRFRSKWLLYERLYASGRWDENELALHARPIMAFAQHAESGRFRESVLHSG